MLCSAVPPQPCAVTTPATLLLGVAGRAFARQRKLDRNVAFGCHHHRKRRCCLCGRAFSLHCSSAVCVRLWACTCCLLCNAVLRNALPPLAVGLASLECRCHVAMVTFMAVNDHRTSRFASRRRSRLSRSFSNCGRAFSLHCKPILLSVVMLLTRVLASHRCFVRCATGSESCPCPLPQGPESHGQWFWRRRLTWSAAAAS